MKRILYILTFLIGFTTLSYAQDDDRNGKKIQEQMNLYVQKRLGLSKAEAERFSPVFKDYYDDLRKTNQEFRGDKLVLQKKVADLRLRYRNQFKNIVGEKKSNDVFNYERDFIEEVRGLMQDRRQNQNENRGNKRSRGLLQ